MNLYFIRHAEPDYEHDTITECGKEQAALLADWLADIAVDELYHSSMGRAGMTAGYLAEKWNVPAVPLDWARELRWGKADGSTADAMSPWAINERRILDERRYPAGDSWRNLPELQGDSLPEDIDSHCAALDTFLAEHGYKREGQLYTAVSPNEKTVVIVCHGGTISALVSHLLNIPFWQYIAHEGVDLTAVTRLHFRGTQGVAQAAQLVYMNSQAHLGIK